MTICIADIAKDNGIESIVFSTDHMVTVTGIGQFEHPKPKYRVINKNTVAMLSGGTLFFDELISNIDPNLDYEGIKKQIYENFKKSRIDHIDKEILSVYSLEHKFIPDMLRGAVPNRYTDEVLGKVGKYSLNTAVLLIGFIGKDAQITSINEFDMFDWRRISFNAIGSGYMQAVNTMYFQKQGKSETLPATLYAVYKAKRNAEVLQGVGKETDLLILTQNGCKKINDNDIKLLDNVYQKELEFGRKHKDLSKVNVNLDYAGE